MRLLTNEIIHGKRYLLPCILFFIILLYYDATTVPDTVTIGTWVHRMLICTANSDQLTDALNIDITNTCGSYTNGIRIINPVFTTTNCPSNIAWGIRFVQILNYEQDTGVLYAIVVIIGYGTDASYHMWTNMHIGVLGGNWKGWHDIQI